MYHRSFLTTIIFIILLKTTQGFTQNHQLILDDVQASVGQDICIPVKINKDIGMITMHCFFSFSADRLQFTGVSTLNLPGLSSSDFNFSPPDKINMSWASPGAACMERNGGDTFFTLCFKVLENLAYLKLDSGRIDLCLPTIETILLPSDTSNIVTTNTSGIAQPIGPLHQVNIYPNPVSEDLSFNFHLDERHQINLLIFDPSGEACFTVSQNGETGSNTLIIPKTALPGNGCYRFLLEVGDAIKTGSLIKLP